MESYLSHRIEELIAKVQTQDHLWPIAAIAREHHALTVYCDMGGCLALRPNGEVLCIPDDPATSVHVETDALQRNLALVQAGKRYSDLRDLYPVRPDDAISCSDCGGTGTNPVTAHAGFEAIICKCAGTGWLPVESMYCP
jgi:hypothetical protein